MSRPSADIQFNVAAQSAVNQMQMFANLFKRQIQDMKREVQRFNQTKNESPFAQWANDAMRLGAALAGVYGPLQVVQKAAELVRKELENAVEVAKYAAERQVPYEYNLQAIYRAMPSDIKDPNKTLSEIDTILKSSKVTNKSELAAMATVASSSALNIPYADRFRIAAGIAEKRPDLFAMDRSGLLEMMKQSMVAEEAFRAGQGIKMDQETFADAQMALMSKGVTMSFVGDTKLYGRNIGNTAAKLSQYGFNQFEGLAMGNALSNAIKDSEGNITSDAIQNLFPAVITYAKQKGIDMPGSMEGMLDYIRSDVDGAKQIRSYMIGALSEQFQLSDEERAMLSEAQQNKLAQEHLPGRAKSAFQVAQLFQPTGASDGPNSINTLFKVAMDQLGVVRNQDGSINVEKSYDAQAERSRQESDFIKSNPLFKSSNLAYGLESATETGAFSNDSISGLRDRVFKLLKESGMDYSSQKMWEAYDYFGSKEPGSALQRYDEMLSKQAGNILRRKTAGYYSNGEFIGGDSAMRDYRISPEEQKGFDLNDATVNVLNEMLGVLQEIARAQGKPIPVKDDKKPLEALGNN